MHHKGHHYPSVDFIERNRMRSDPGQQERENRCVLFEAAYFRGELLKA